MFKYFHTQQTNGWIRDQSGYIHLWERAAQNSVRGLAVVVHPFNPNMQESEEGKSL